MILNEVMHRQNNLCFIKSFPRMNLFYRIDSWLGLVDQISKKSFDNQSFHKREKQNLFTKWVCLIEKQG